MAEKVYVTRKSVRLMLYKVETQNFDSEEDFERNNWSSYHNEDYVSSSFVALRNVFKKLASKDEFNQEYLAMNGPICTYTCRHSNGGVRRIKMIADRSIDRIVLEKEIELVE